MFDRRLPMPAALQWLFAALFSAISVPVSADEPYGRFQFSDAELDHWAYQPLQSPPVPVVQNGAWVQSPIDAFILAELESRGWQPSAPADRQTLLRRLFLDLIGLPPTPDEQRSFLNDESPGAVPRLVDRLLARSEYGERWGRHWLDLVRYAESNGYERDGAKPNVWRYRDWVIDAFNQDLPYDQFVQYQLAGDEIDNSIASTQIATTFLRLGPWDDEPADPDVDRYDQLDDIVGATTATFMAQTVRCARCHDHKFEAFSQRDYTRLLAVFEPLKRPQDGRTDLDRPVGTRAELDVYEAALGLVETKLTEVHGQIDLNEQAVCQRLIAAGLLTSAAPAGGVDAAAGEPTKPPAAEPPLPADAVAAFEAAPPERTPAQIELIKKYRSKLRGFFLTHATPEENKALDDLQRRVEVLEATRPPSPPRAYIWMEEGPQAPVTRVLKRGNPRDPAEEVGPGVPAILIDGPLPAPTPTDRSTGRRLQLAQWLTRPDNPLTARVMVNRIWQHHFGDGLAGSENDFGIMGEPPSHGELLNWLAVRFIESGWSIKHMHRLLVLSSTYQMSSSLNEEAQRRDPECNLLWRFQPRRLEAEAIRDSILAASGQLNRRAGGPSVYPAIAQAVLESQSRPGSGWETSNAIDAVRRGVYVFVKRTLLLPEFEVLDFPDTNGTCEQRRVSTVAPQALTMLNGQFVHEQAAHCARRLRSACPSAAAQVQRAFELTLSRSPTDAEVAAALEFLAAQEAQIRADSAAEPIDDAAARALAAFCLVLFNTNEFVYLR